MTPPAILTWAAYFGWINVVPGPFWFIAWGPVVVLLTAWAIFELVIDKTAKIGNRTGIVGLLFRIVTSGFSAAVLSSTAGMGLAIGIISGLFGGVIGTFGGYYLRKKIVQDGSLGDLPVAVAEDVIAISLGVMCVYFARI
jgi:uncharacterized membrane protein